MLLRKGRWLMQPRDETHAIVPPVAGALWRESHSGKTPEQALRRHRRTAHVFWAELPVHLEQLRLLAGQEIGLISPVDQLAGSIWSSNQGTCISLADERLEVMQLVFIVQMGHNKVRSIDPGRRYDLPLAPPWRPGRAFMLDRDSFIDFKSEDLWLWGVADGTGFFGQVSMGGFVGSDALNSLRVCSA